MDVPVAPWWGVAFAKLRSTPPQDQSPQALSSASPYTVSMATAGRSGSTGHAVGPAPLADRGQLQASASNHSGSPTISNRRVTRRREGIIYRYDGRQRG